MAIPKSILGKTGIEVTALGLGGVCWNLLDEAKDAVAVVLRAIDRGITYLYTASSYKQSERRLGLALMERDRSKLFVTTKCIKRSSDELKREIEERFQRLQLETIDLMQLHAIDEEENLDEVLGSDGALRVIEEYQVAGKIRFVGLTGHTAPAQFERMLVEYDFDMLLNPAGPAVNRVWNDFIGTSMAAARRLGMGVVAMKVMDYGQVPPEDRPDYMRYTMGQDVDVAIVGMNTVE